MKTFLQHYEELMTREEQGLPSFGGQTIRDFLKNITAETPIRDVVLGLLTPELNFLELYYDPALVKEIEKDFIYTTTFNTLWQNLFLLAHEIENDPEMMEFVTKYFNGEIEDDD